MNVSCKRCSRVMTLEIDGVDVDDDDDVSVDIAGGAGMVIYVCVECATARELWQRMAESAAKALEQAEEAISAIEMVMSRIPGARDNPQFQADHAHAQETAEGMRRALDVLLANEPREGL
jgi:hypothetical protein